MEVAMRHVVLALALLAGSVGVASAQGVQFDVGPGGVHVGPRYHHPYGDDWRWRHRHETYGYAGDCRVVVRTRINQWGERVTVRRRICD